MYRSLPVGHPGEMRALTGAARAGAARATGRLLARGSAVVGVGIVAFEGATMVMQRVHGARRRLGVSERVIGRELRNERETSRVPGTRNRRTEVCVPCATGPYSDRWDNTSQAEANGGMV